MSLLQGLETGVDNYANCVKSIRYSVALLVTGIVLQIYGFTVQSWSSSPTSFHGVTYLCHQSNKFTCCDKFDTEWMTAVLAFQCLGLSLALPTMVCGILFTCVSRTRGKKCTKTVLQMTTLLTALFLGVSCVIYSSSYWKNHMLADHHLSTSFTTVILACLSHLITSIIVTVRDVTDIDEETTSLFETYDEETSPLEIANEETPLLETTNVPPANCVVCMDRSPNVRFNCDHVVCCRECAHQLHASDYRCPVCRTHIMQQTDV